MNIRKNIYVLLVVIISCCTNSKEDIHGILSSDCFWDMKDPDGIVRSCYKFDVGGQCRFYSYYFYNKNKTDSVSQYFDDVMESNNWNLENDSTISILEIDYKILNFNNDSIILRKKRGDTLILVKNCRAFIGKSH